ncbi:hypothetical protein JB92DRAFT_3035739, partial [Gautieria morchelliformis]
MPAEQTSEILNGALVEVHLAPSHNHIRKQGESFDSFNSNIRQIIVHTPGSARPISPYKRKVYTTAPSCPLPDQPLVPSKGKLLDMYLTRS